MMIGALAPENVGSERLELPTEYLIAAGESLTRPSALT